MLLQLGHIDPWPYSGVSVDHLKLVEGELFERLDPDPVAFPTPPFAGRPGEIEPICDLFALAREGEEQGNCALSLLSEVLCGDPSQPAKENALVPQEVGAIGASCETTLDSMVIGAGGGA